MHLGTGVCSCPVFCLEHWRILCSVSSGAARRRGTAGGTRRRQGSGGGSNARGGGNGAADSAIGAIMCAGDGDSEGDDGEVVEESSMYTRCFSGHCNIVGHKQARIVPNFLP